MPGGPFPPAGIPNCLAFEKSGYKVKHVNASDASVNKRSCSDVAELLDADVSALSKPSKVNQFSSGPDGDVSRPVVSATRNRTTSYLQAWRIISRSALETAHYRREVRCCAKTDEGEKRMGSFWKKMLRLSSARSKGLTHGADFDTSEVRSGFL